MPLLQASPRSYSVREKEALNRVTKEFNDMSQRISEDAFKMIVKFPVISLQKEIAAIQKCQTTLMTNMLNLPRLDFGKSAIDALNRATSINIALSDYVERSVLFQGHFAPNFVRDNITSKTEYEIGQVEEYDTNQLAIGATLFQIGIKLLSEPRQSPQATSDNIANLSLLPTSEFRYGTRTLNSITTASREGRLLKLLLTSPHNHATKEIIDNEFKDHSTDRYKLRKYIIKTLNKENLNIEIKSLRTNGYVLESISPIH